jgi:NADPH:quinone reductase-like Zn-dependent oxidoreductase
MKAFIADRYGRGPLRAGEVPQPEVGDADVLVEVHAAGVNVLDAKLRNGEFKRILPYRPPFVLGHDVAGVVVRVGSRVRGLKPGDEVYSRVPDGRIGTFAEFIAIDEDAVAIKPENLTMEEAASIPLVGLTAWQALVERADLKKGQRVFVQAGSGGVGTFAIQLARHLGADVATTTSAANADWVKALGADVVVDYRKEDFAHILRGYDVVLHSQDAGALEKSLQVLRPGGKLVSISGPPDPDFARQLGAGWIVEQLMRVLSRRARKEARRRDVNYSFLFMKASGGQLREIAALIESGAIRPVVDRVFPFEQANEALAHVEGGRAKGKVVVKVR